MAVKIAWQGRVGIENIDKLKGDIDKALAQNEGLVFDISQVDAIDTAAIQMLMALIKEHKKSKFTLNFEGQVTKEVNRRLLMGGFIKQSLTDGSGLLVAFNNLN
jgi:anti-anti-sigma regulatory factor